MSDPGDGEILLLHEVIDIVGLGAWPYMEHTARARGDEKVNFVLQGTWYTMGITGRWSQVVNLWDVPGGWEGWHTAVERLNLQRRANKDLEQWWQEAFRHRSGGFDRLLVGAPGCPTTAQSVAAGVRCDLFVHELTEVRPGAQRDYLAAVADQRVAVMADFGHTLTGLYEVAMNDTEVITTWATGVEAHVRLQRATADRDPRVTAWQATARGFATRRREELMTPYPGTPLGPPAGAERPGDEER
jgi:hypothetical protein